MITMLFCSAVYGGLHHNVCNVGSHSVIVLDIFQTGITSIRWQKWLTATGQKITVTGQIMVLYASSTQMHACTLSVILKNP